MADKNETLKLIHMNEVETTEISWLWYPLSYMEKSRSYRATPGRWEAVMLTIASAVTTGAGFTGEQDNREPMSVISQPAKERGSMICNVLKYWGCAGRTSI